MDARRQVPGEADIGSNDGAKNRLALGTDVEQPGTKGKTNPKPGADQRSGLGSRLGDRAVPADSALDQGRVRAADLVPGRDQRIRGPSEEVPELASHFGVGNDHQQRTDD